RQLATELKPFVGPVVSVAKGLYGMYSVGKYLTGRAESRKKNEAAVQLGDPRAALAAVQQILDRQNTQTGIDAGRNLLAGVGGVAVAATGVGAAGGLAISVVNALAHIAATLWQVVRDFKERKAGNDRLATPETLDATVFNDCPILGCYL